MTIIRKHINVACCRIGPDMYVYYSSLCASCADRNGYCFLSVPMSVCLSIQKQHNYSSEIDVTWYE